MSVKRAFATFIRDDESGMIAEIATISPGALEDEGLADMLKAPFPGDFFGALHDLESDESSPLELIEVDVDQKDLGAGGFGRLLASALTARTVTEAQTRWAMREESSPRLSDFVYQILDTQVLAEHSDPAAMKASGAIGAAAVTAEGSVFVALVTTGHVAGVAIMIASPIGIIIVGAGAAGLAYRLLTHRRRKRR